MSAREDIDRVCRRESSAAMLVHDQAHAYVAGDILAEELLTAASIYAERRLERERLQDQLWGGSS
ncbi:hypothetical protein [Dietzia cercidiphylli]|uniref:Uncharacterized protein n=1 Tax=Dietzia cercidiphylli TaxID=498199 RepID=A0ABP4V1T6_9ACTN|nr:hypothetical protein [Dietzia cercidiphylli]MBB1046952.1 hypothetical protein [Dietzia cercidiphylli]